MSEHGAENVAGLAQAKEPCWSPIHRDGYAFEWGEGTPHWETVEAANEGIASILTQHDEDESPRPLISLSRESEPCWHLTCDGCGYRYDEDEWVSHFMSKIDAQNAAGDCDWHVEDGRLLCFECVIPPVETGEPS